jgi:uncharacterized protein
MVIRHFRFLTTVVGFVLISCTNEQKQRVEQSGADTLTNQSTSMNSYISIFEIPALDISRAVRFYQNILDLKIETMEMPGMKMGIFPYEQQVVNGVIIEADSYKPSADGITVYLNCGDNLQLVLDKVEKEGGKVITSKTPHADGNGYFAIFLDSEGNRMGLNSPN